MGRIITARLLGFVSGGLGLALVACVIFAWVQTGRLSSANDVIKALRGQVEILNVRIIDAQSQIATRDDLITSQNAGIEAITKAVSEHSAAYKARIADADRKAATRQQEAAAIMARQASTEDELGRAREALRLIQEAVGSAEQDTN